MSHNSITTFHKDVSNVKDNNMYDRRNKLLLEFLLKNSLNNIRLIGNAKSPVIIYNEEVRLSCYVEDFNLILRDSYKNASIISTLALDTKRVIDAESLLLDFLHTSEHSEVYRVGLKSTPGLFLAGYNYRDKANKLGKEPVFSILEARIYLTFEAAKKAINELPNYPLEII